jgi:hypothetical protein
MVTFDDGKNYIQMGHLLVEEDALRIAQAVKDYDENLDIICLDPSMPGVKCTSAPFMVIQRVRDGTYQKVFECWELDMRVLERLWAADQHRNNQWQTLQQMELAAKEGMEKRYRERIIEAGELAFDILKSPRSSYTVLNKDGDELTFREDSPVVTRNREKKSFS